MIDIVLLVNELKKYLQKNKNNSDVFDHFFLYFDNNELVKRKKMTEAYGLDKSTVSNIMSHKREIPSAYVDAVKKVEFSLYRDYLKECYEKSITAEDFERFVNNIYNMYVEDGYFTKQEKSKASNYYTKMDFWSLFTFILIGVIGKKDKKEIPLMSIVGIYENKVSVGYAKTTYISKAVRKLAEKYNAFLLENITKYKELDNRWNENENRDYEYDLLLSSEIRKAVSIKIARKYFSGEQITEFDLWDYYKDVHFSLSERGELGPLDYAKRLVSRFCIFLNLCLISENTLNTIFGEKCEFVKLGVSNNISEKIEDVEVTISFPSGTVYYDNNYKFKDTILAGIFSLCFDHIFRVKETTEIGRCKLYDEYKEVNAGSIIDIAQSKFGAFHQYRKVADDQMDSLKFELKSLRKKEIVFIPTCFFISKDCKFINYSIKTGDGDRYDGRIEIK